MAKVLQPITACLKKGEVIDDKDDNSSQKQAPSQDKNSISDVAQPGLLWRVSSQVYNIGTGVVGAGVGSIKWAASTTYNVGSGVISATQTAVSKVVPSSTPKPKND